ncbi:MAG: DUF1294 domain-containing protein [Oligoflexia bacterium]|nr:DUF1294 domain-containing protein [Oligoflexia bacterium]
MAKSNYQSEHSSKGNAKSVNAVKFFVAGAVFLTLASGGLAYFYSNLGPIFSYLIGINIALLLLCGFDKSIAGGQSTRVPELVFYAFAILGGSVGLLLGMHLFRHKTKKGAFQIVLVAIIFVQAIAIRLIQRKFGLF